LTVLDGSLPGLRTGTNPTPSRSATVAPKMNPRLSMPTTASIDCPLKGDASASMAWPKPSPSRSRVVMS
jgi:hypothetical protein